MPTQISSTGLSKIASSTNSSDNLYRTAMRLEMVYYNSLKKRHFKTANRLKKELDVLWDKFAIQARKECYEV